MSKRFIDVIIDGAWKPIGLTIFFGVAPWGFLIFVDFFGDWEKKFNVMFIWASLALIGYMVDKAFLFIAWKVKDSNYIRDDD